MPDPDAILADTRFLDGGGEAARMIRARDWSDHPLGPPAGWPTTLKTALSLVVNSPESMILAWGPDLTFFFNDTYFPLLGPRLSWAMGARFDEVWADALDQAMPIVERALAGQPERFTDLPWKLATDRGAEDTWWSFSYSRILDEAGDVAGLFILTNETTSRVLTDAALAQSQRDLAALNATLERRVEERTAERDRLWESSPDLLVVVDYEGRFTRANPAWADILGYAPDEVVGMTPWDFCHPDDRIITDAAVETSRAGTMPIFENRFRHKDGSYRWISWVSATSGEEIFATGRHVTQVKEAEAALRAAEDQLRQSQKVEAVGQLTGGVAHDFNNLLTVIRGSVDLLRRPGISDDRRTRYIDAIADTAERASRLTNQLLAFARRQALKPEVIDVGASIAALLPMIQTLAGARIAIRVDPPAAPCHIDADQSQFDTAIINVAVNARDAMAGEGTLSIVIDTVERLPAIRSHDPVTGRFVRIAMTDTGSGIAPERIEQIFEPFFTTKGIGEGTGLGLSQVFGFAKQSGGEIVADSDPGAGATFTLYLPAVPAPVAARTDDTAAGPATIPNDVCVLVVEDDVDVGSFAVQALTELGYRSTLAVNATAALAALDSCDHGIDVVFSDVVMPGMSGVDLAREIRARHPDLPVILTSGYSSVLAEDGTGGFALLRKPYSIDQLAGALGTATTRS